MSCKNEMLGFIKFVILNGYLKMFGSWYGIFARHGQKSHMFHLVACLNLAVEYVILHHKKTKTQEKISLL